MSGVLTPEKVTEEQLMDASVNTIFEAANVQLVNYYKLTLALDYALPVTPSLFIFYL